MFVLWEVRKHNNNISSKKINCVPDVICEPLFNSSLSFFHSVVVKRFSVACTFLCSYIVNFLWGHVSVFWVDQIGDKWNLWAFPLRLTHPCISMLSASALTLVTAFGQKCSWLSTQTEKRLCFLVLVALLWSLLLMYLVTYLKCLALLWGWFCNFACFTNAS